MAYVLLGQLARDPQTLWLRWVVNPVFLLDVAKGSKCIVIGSVFLMILRNLLTLPISPTLSLIFMSLCWLAIPTIQISTQSDLLSVMKSWLEQLFIHKDTPVRRLARDFVDGAETQRTSVSGGRPHTLLVCMVNLSSSSSASLGGRQAATHKSLTRKSWQFLDTQGKMVNWNLMK